MNACEGGGRGLTSALSEEHEGASHSIASLYDGAGEQGLKDERPAFKSNVQQWGVEQKPVSRVLDGSLKSG